MTVSRTLAVDGQYVSGRLTGGTARVVLNTPPDLTQARTDGGAGAFIPETTIRSNISRRTFRRPLVGCGAVRRPASYSGLDLLSVMTIDLDRGLYSVDRDAVIAGRAGRLRLADRASTSRASATCRASTRRRTSRRA